MNTPRTRHWALVSLVTSSKQTWTDRTAERRNDDRAMTQQWWTRVDDTQRSSMMTQTQCTVVEPPCVPVTIVTTVAKVTERCRRKRQQHRFTCEQRNNGNTALCEIDHESEVKGQGHTAVQPYYLYSHSLYIINFYYYLFIFIFTLGRLVKIPSVKSS